MPGRPDVNDLPSPKWQTQTITRRPCYHGRRGGRKEWKRKWIAGSNSPGKKTRQFCLRLNKETEDDIIAHLEAQPSMQGYLKRLIREDIKRESREE